MNTSLSNLIQDKVGEYIHLEKALPQMLLRETIRKTKFFFHKTLQDVKSFFFGGYQKLPRSLSFNPFSRRSGNAGTYTSEQFYYEFYDQWQSDLKRLKMIDDSNSISGSKPKEPEMENAAESNGSLMGSANQSPANKCIDEEDRAEEKNRKECLSSEKVKKGGGALVLAQKMKEMDMMNAGDVEHLLDIEEALYYYSRLRSPVYLEIVDKFFMDMHSEFSVPPRLTAPDC